MDDKTIDFISFLPPTVWYLTSSGVDMWCRKPYAFFFSSKEAATAFATSMGTSFELVPIGVSSMELVSEASLSGIRALQVTRIFVDPTIDPATGDVVGKILRLEDVH